MGNNDQAYIFTATIAHFYGVFIKDFEHFMFLEMTIDQLEEILNNICFHNFWKGRIILCWRFLIYFLFLFSLSWWYIRFSSKPLLIKDFSYSILNLSDTSFDYEFLDNLLLMDFRSCFDIWDRWLELIFLYIGSFGFLNGWQDSVFKFKVISRKSKGVIFDVTFIESSQSLTLISQQKFSHTIWAEIYDTANFKIWKIYQAYEMKSFVIP